MRFFQTTSVKVLLFSALLLALATASLSVGASEVGWEKALQILWEALGLGARSAEITDQERFIILSIRLPRTLSAMLIGAGLSAAGACVQGLFRNPLAEPGLLGVSSGATLGAVVWIVLGGSWAAGLSLWAQPVFAFLFGLGATGVLYAIASYGGGFQSGFLLLAGVAVNAALSAAIGLFIFISTDQQLRAISFWTLGSLSATDWATTGVLAAGLSLFFLLTPLLARPLNLLQLGEAEAHYLGLNLPALKRIVAVAVAFAVGLCVAFTGVIGFVGLAAPHLVRLMTGPDYRKILPVSLPVGAALLAAADLLCRTLAAPAEIPIGVLTAAIGAPFFLFMLIKNAKNRRL